MQYNNPDLPRNVGGAIIDTLSRIPNIDPTLVRLMQNALSSGFIDEVVMQLPQQILNSVGSIQYNDLISWLSANNNAVLANLMNIVKARANFNMYTPNAPVVQQRPMYTVPMNYGQPVYQQQQYGYPQPPMGYPNQNSYMGYTQPNEPSNGLSMLVNQGATSPQNSPVPTQQAAQNIATATQIDRAREKQMGLNQPYGATVTDTATPIVDPQTGIVKEDKPFVTDTYTAIGLGDTGFPQAATVTESADSTHSQYITKKRQIIVGNVGIFENVNVQLPIPFGTAKAAVAFAGREISGLYDSAAYLQKIVYTEVQIDRDLHKLYGMDFPKRLFPVFKQVQEVITDVLNAKTTLQEITISVFKLINEAPKDVRDYFERILCIAINRALRMCMFKPTKPVEFVTINSLRSIDNLLLDMSADTPDGVQTKQFRETTDAVYGPEKKAEYIRIIILTELADMFHNQYGIVEPTERILPLLANEEEDLGITISHRHLPRDYGQLSAQEQKQIVNEFARRHVLRYRKRQLYVTGLDTKTVDVHPYCTLICKPVNHLSLVLNTVMDSTTDANLITLNKDHSVKDIADIGIDARHAIKISHAKKYINNNVQTGTPVFLIPK